VGASLILEKYGNHTGGKDGVLVFGFLVKNKNLESSDFLVFNGFYGYYFFAYKFCVQTTRLLFLYYNLIFNLLEFITLFSVCRLILLQYA